MSISNVGSAPAAANVSNVNSARRAYAAEAAKPAAPQARADSVELTRGGSEMQRLVGLAKQGDVRADKVADLKAQIASGSYDLDAKADAVADRLLDDLGL